MTAKTVRIRFIEMSYVTVCRTSLAAGIVLGGFVLGVIAPAHAIDGIAVTGGEGRNSNMEQISVQWQWSKRWFQSEHMHVGGFWDAGIAQWRRDETPGWTDHLSEINFTPTFRLQANDLQGPYVEAGVGFHLLSETQLGNKRYSTTFQFGEHLGFGWRFGARGTFDLGYRYQHISNADIKTPNSGADFHQIRLQYWFR